LEDEPTPRAAPRLDEQAALVELPQFDRAKPSWLTKPATVALTAGGGILTPCVVLVLIRFALINGRDPEDNKKADAKNTRGVRLRRLTR